MKSDVTSEGVGVQGCACPTQYLRTTPVLSAPAQRTWELLIEFRRVSRVHVSSLCSQH
eukprot:m.476464 g.476464  ORF g.476464 m.476464 type:complete len:58 (+) comp40899_c0_seq1:154-327(+)